MFLKFMTHVKYQQLTILLSLVCFSLLNCGKPDYQTAKSEALATGFRNDSIFFDFKFGDTRDYFYSHCFELNRAGILTNGHQNMSVQYALPEFTEHKVYLDFYPDFCQGKICSMIMTFNYEAWSPWAKELYANKLVPQVVKWFEEKYDTKFEAYQITEKQRKLIALDGNREIQIWVKDERYVEARMIDLTAKPDPVDPNIPVGPKPTWVK
jgi:hypothetical protein